MRLWNLYRKGIISADKTLDVYFGLYHEVFNEPKRELVLRDVDPWIENNPTAGFSF
jgi:alpha-beta hydrolase superfamily lysophospholipase